MTKYKEYVKRMIEENKILFDSFRIIHDEYALNPDVNQEKINLEGEKVLKVVREWEDRLCRNQEKTYSRFAGNLAEKFQSELKKLFPMIDHVGIVVKRKEPEFRIKMIKLQ